MSKIIKQGDCRWGKQLGKKRYVMQYQLMDNGTLIISGNDMLLINEVDKEKSKSYTVYRSFFEKMNATRLIIEEGVTAIGEYCFLDCKTIKTISVPDSLRRIDKCAFAGCEGLTEVTLPNGVEELDFGVFERCTNLAKLNFSSNIRSISSSALDETAIQFLFEDRGCYLGSIDNPRHIFMGCLVDGGILDYYSKDFKEKMRNVKSLRIAEGTTVIADEACYGLEYLTSLTLPSTLKHIGVMSFCDCFNLEVLNLPEGLISIDENAFYNLLRVEHIRIPDSIQELDFLSAFDYARPTSISVPKHYIPTLHGRTWNEPRDKWCKYVPCPVEFRNPDGTIAETLDYRPLRGQLRLEYEQKTPLKDRDLEEERIDAISVGTAF